MMRSSVVLPQPDGPTKQTSSPRSIVRSTDCSATKLPKALWMPCSYRAAAAIALILDLPRSIAAAERPGPRRPALCRVYFGAALLS